MPSMTSQSKTPSQSGIATTDSGERHIPSSTRPDGSVRKEIRVRPGYRPPEDVEVYKNRTAQAWKGRSSGAIPGAEHLLRPKPKPKKAPKKETKAENNAAKAPAEIGVEQNEEDGERTNGDGEEELVDPEAEKEKEAKKLLKKLRQARELQERKESGAALLPEQLEKVIRINELIRQLNGLGFDAEGQQSP